MPATPLQQYEKLLAERRAALAQLDARDRRLSWARLTTLAVGVLVGWAVFDPDRLALGWLLVPVAVFVALMVAHERLSRRREATRRAVRFYERGVERLTDRWQGRGFDGAAFAEAEHPYAADLDLFGPGSLFELLCTARTGIGRRTLASWLLGPPSAEETRGRQGAVRELTPRLALRERLAILGDDLAHRLHPEALASWAAEPPRFASPALRWIAPALVAFLFLSALALVLGAPGARVLLGLAFAAHAGFALRLRQRVDRVQAEVRLAARELPVLAGVLAQLETESFEHPRLAGLLQGLRGAGGAAAPPSRQIAQLDRLIRLLDSQRNQIFAPLSLLLLWGTQASLAIERWRARHGAAVAQWLQAVGDFEALSSLAGHAWENPDDVFPVLVEQGPLWEGSAVGHPLIPRTRCVANDLVLGPDARLLIVSGSNMSGKSTLMRTVGVNTVLGLAGGTVRARSLRLSPLRVGGSIRVQDSLQKNMSGFYAEIYRLHQLVSLADGRPPLLFLLEEILHTTNSHDRRTGARAVLASLLERGAVGIVTTHDLAVTAIATELESARNVHFVDHLEGDRIRFDYVLREGVVDRSNAIDLMRSIGLEV